MRAIGVLGGMGPEATLDFLAKLYAADTAPCEQERLRVLVDCNPAVLDRNAAVTGAGPSPGPILAAMARGLEASGAGCLVIACNTAHAWSADVRSAVEIPLIDMIETACAEVAQRVPRARRVGLLAGDGCLAAGIYQRALARRDLHAVVPGQDARAGFMEALYQIKAGRAGATEKAALLAYVRETEEAGAEVVIAACTEVPLLLTQADVSLPMIDAGEVLAKHAAAWARA